MKPTVNPVVICLSGAGEAMAHKVAKSLNAQVHGRECRVDVADAYFPNARDYVRTLFASGTPIVGVCAAGILIRAVAPILADKRNEPPVIAVSDDGAVVVPLLGGHRGANRLAKQISEAVGGVAAVTTAGDVALGFALDEPPAGYRLANPQDAKPVMAAMLNGATAHVTGEPLFEIASDENGKVEICVTESPVEGGDNKLVYHPQRYALGLGCARNADPQDMWELVEKTLADAGIAQGAIASVSSIDLKADEPAIINVAKRLDVPFRLFDAAALEAKTPRLENPSDVVFAKVGCHGVSDGAALAATNQDAILVVGKQKTATCTCAITRQSEPIVEHNGRARGKLSIIGIGPGQHSWRPPEASQLIAQAEELVGYGLYID
ncbi:precorrin-3B methylase, partial [Marinosulfonomonas sp. PRT-SC04]